MSENIKINNKLESVEAINKLGLNKLPEGLFRKNDVSRIKEFLNKYPAKCYAIRDKSNSSGVFKLKVPANEVFNEILEYDLFSINVSSINYSDNQLLVGEIEILSDGGVYAVLSTNPYASVRDALKKPEFNLKTDIFDNRLNDIPCFDFLYQYIIEHELKDIIVEFSLFNINVGINNEKIVIYELRTNY